MASSMIGAATGAMSQGGGEGVISDAVTNAMVSHMLREATGHTMSFWPVFMAKARRYFNVTHGYVLRKMLWQLVPVPSTKKKASEGELGGEKEWTTRVFEGLEVDIEEPDLYIPTMGFVTYVLLCGLIQGLQEQFKPEVLSTTINYALLWCIVETTVVKAALFSAGAVNAPVGDLVTMLGYKYFYLSLQLIAGLILGWGYKPQGFLYGLVSIGLFASCGVALWQALKRLSRMQPQMGQECVSELHKLIIKCIPVLQALVIWFLLPKWPGPRPVKETAAAAVTTVTTVLETTIAAVAPVVEQLAENATA